MPDPVVAAVAHVTELVGDRWSLPLLVALRHGPRRFSDLGDDLPGLAPNILSRRLDELERGGLVVARPYQTRPLRRAYELTARGAELVEAVGPLAAWGDPHIAVHAVCGTALAPRWWCPTCERSVGEPDEDVLRA